MMSTLTSIQVVLTLISSFIIHQAYTETHVIRLKCPVQTSESYTLPAITSFKFSGCGGCISSGHPNPRAPTGSNQLSYPIYFNDGDQFFITLSEITLTVAERYIYNEWSNWTQCTPLDGYVGNSTKQRVSDACYDKKSSPAASVDIQKCGGKKFHVQKCPGFGDWGGWSICYPSNNICGINGSRWRTVDKCINSTGSEIDLKECGERPYHVQDCVSACAAWTTWTPCELYKPDVQNNKDGIPCGNGFEFMNKTCDWCGIAGMQIRNCYIQCPDNRIKSNNAPMTLNDLQVNWISNKAQFNVSFYLEQYNVSANGSKDISIMTFGTINSIINFTLPKILTSLHYVSSFAFKTSEANSIVRLNSLQGFFPGVWGMWGDWNVCNGNCTNGVYNRSRKCFKDMELKEQICIRLCIGQFEQFDQCRCPELYKWDVNSFGEWGECYPTNFSSPYNASSPCGTGLKLRTAEQCLYEDKPEDYYKKLCGLKPVHARSCFKICPDTCERVGKHTKQLTVGDTQISSNNSIVYNVELNLAGTTGVSMLKSWNYYETMNFTKIGTHSILSVAVNGTIKISGSIAAITFCYFPDWSEYIEGDCNVTCGNGTQNVTRQCQGSNGVALEDYYCKGKPEPYQQKCQTNIVCFNYTTWEKWSQCEGECGYYAEQYRTRDCLGDFGEKYDGINCTHLGQWNESESCELKDYPCLNWTTWTSWEKLGDCDVVNQVKHRHCNKDENGTITTVPNQKCKNRYGNHGENITTYDFGFPCFYYGNWTDKGCNVSCENGTRTFERLCYNFDRILTDISKCVTHGPPVKYNVCVTNRECFGVGPWNEWTTVCTETCGTGKLNRTRECLGTQVEACALKGLLQMMDCNTHPCPIDGYWTKFSDWSTCSVSCGNGTIKRNRNCIPPNFNGLPCERNNHLSFDNGVETHVRQCTTGIHCPGITFGIKNESCLDVCSVKQLVCSPEMRKYVNNTYMFSKFYYRCYNTLNREYSKNYHPSYDEKLQECAGYIGSGEINCTVIAPVGIRRVCNCLSPDDIIMGEWNVWGECSRSCGLGKRTRFRELAISGSQSLRFGNEESCSLIPCPVDGYWSDWTEFSTCDVTCGKGKQERRRFCNNPKPLHGGLQCGGDAVDHKACGYPPLCPVDGGWTEWSNFTMCDAACGKEIHTSRHRECKNPAPDFGGLPCIGEAAEVKHCQVSECIRVSVSSQVDLVKKECKGDEYNNLNSIESQMIIKELKDAIKEMYAKQPNMGKVKYKINIHSLRCSDRTEEESKKR